MSDNDLSRFVEAQALVYPVAEAELRSGRKRSHWMWFVFPQISGLGHSPIAKTYAIRDHDEARRYLAHPVLGARLACLVEAMLEHEDKSARDILGSPDDLKFRSCLTLFEAVSRDEAERLLFGAALDRFYAGLRDARTLALLNPG